MFFRIYAKWGDDGGVVALCIQYDCFVFSCF